MELETAPAESAKLIPVPAVIETNHYWAKIDPTTGALDSLKTKPSGREVLSGPVLLVAESGLDAHDTPERPQRKRLADSRQFPAAVRVDGRSVGDGGVGAVQILRWRKVKPDHPLLQGLAPD